jgi:CheY-like chemotaxis protein
MAARKKLLLLDDDEDLLEVYREMLSRLPSQPEIHTANSGARAIALLESEPFALLLSDLNMPKMDGLQVITIVRRKFPQVRTAVMTSVIDAQFRSRAYATGIDLFLEKPNGPQEMNFFLDCIESLMSRESDAGFRGVQSKSLVDIIQLECLSQSSSVLKITHEGQTGRIWFLNGDVIDAETIGFSCEAAFHHILSWKTGNFEILPADPSRKRTIFESYHGLLLQSAQALDESQHESGTSTDPHSEAPSGASPVSPLATLTSQPGVEFIVCTDANGQPTGSWGIESPERIALWAKASTDALRSLGEKLQAGPLAVVGATSSQRQLAIVPKPDRSLAVGFRRSLSHEQVKETLKTIVAKWAS